MDPPSTPPKGTYNPDALTARWAPWWDSHTLTPPSPSTMLPPETLEQVWRTAKFVLMHVEPWEAHPWDARTMTLTLADRWLLHHFSTLCAAGASPQHDHMVDWLSHTWCRWAIELEKPVLYDTLHRNELGGCVASSRAVLAHVTARLMRILVPWAPALAEDIWHNLPPACRGSYRSVLQVPWPEAMGSFPNEARAIALAIEVLTALQALRSDARLGPLEHLPQVALVGDPQQCADLDAVLPHITFTARPQSIVLLHTAQREVVRAYTPSGIGIAATLHDPEAQARRTAQLQRELSKVIEAMGYVSNRLDNPDFVARAPVDVVAGERERLGTLQARHNTLRRALEELQQVSASPETKP